MSALPSQVTPYAERLFNDAFNAIADEHKWSMDMRIRMRHAVTSGSRIKNIVELRCELVKRMREPQGGIVLSFTEIGPAVGNRSHDAPAWMVRNKHDGMPRNEVSIECIVSHVCRTLGVDTYELTGNGRMPTVVTARVLVAILARRMTTLSFPAIARVMGRPTHTSVIAMVQRFEHWMAQDERPTVDLGGELLTVGELCDRLGREIGAERRVG